MIDTKSFVIGALAMVALGAVGCSDSGPASPVAQAQTERERVSDPNLRQVSRTDGATDVFIYTDPDTHCEYLIASDYKYGTAMVPRIAENGRAHRGCGQQ
jgi:hypothetical protein